MKCSGVVDGDGEGEVLTADAYFCAILNLILILNLL